MILTLLPSNAISNSLSISLVVLLNQSVLLREGEVEERSHGSYPSIGSLADSS